MCWAKFVPCFCENQLAAHTEGPQKKKRPRHYWRGRCVKRRWSVAFEVVDEDRIQTQTERATTMRADQNGVGRVIGLDVKDRNVR
jgi:hypothetical protein